MYRNEIIGSKETAAEAMLTDVKHMFVDAINVDDIDIFQEIKHQVSKNEEVAAAFDACFGKGLIDGVCLVADQFSANEAYGEWTEKQEEEMNKKQIVGTFS